MRVLMVTMGVSPLLDHILASSHDLIGVAECAPRGPTRNKNTIYNKMVVIFRRLSGGKTLYGYSKKIKVPYLFIAPRDNTFETWVANLNPDIIVVQGMTMLLEKRIIDQSRYGAINLHRSFLPEYRGPNPLFWQYLDGKTDFGVTVHFLDQGEDTGDIIERRRVSFPLGATLNEVNKKLVGEIGARMMLHAMDNIETGRINRISQHHTKSPTPRARNVLRDEHNKVIAWQEWPVERIWHVLRGTQTWLKAIDMPVGIYYGQRWHIDSYERIDSSLWEIGKVYKKRRGRYFVACKDGVIYLSVSFNLKLLLKKALGA